MSELVRDWKTEKKDLEEAFDIISDKLVKADAEIARLKGWLLKAREMVKEGADMTPEVRGYLDEIKALKAENEITISVCNQNTDLKKLVTELADALEDQTNIGFGKEATDLIQRAREATKP
jgi:hypothetical protein